MKRAIICLVIPLLILGIAGCGDEESDIPTESTPKIIKGLSGDTYMNTRFGIKITNLPVDEWTVKALGSEGQGVRAQFGQGAMPQYKLLLMEPVPADQFVDLDEKGMIAPMLEADIPFALVFVDHDEGGNLETYDLTAELKGYAALHSAEIESKKFVETGSATGIQAVLIRSEDIKEALTWFAKGEIRVRCEYWAKEPKFGKYYDVYEQVVGNVLLMGK